MTNARLRIDKRFLQAIAIAACVMLLNIVLYEVSGRLLMSNSTKVPVAILESVEGQVETLADDGKSWRALEVGQPLFDESVIKTRAASRAAIAFLGSSEALTLGPNSSVSLRWRQGQQQVSLLEGQATSSSSALRVADNTQRGENSTRQRPTNEVTWLGPTADLVVRAPLLADARVSLAWRSTKPISARVLIGDKLEGLRELTTLAASENTYDLAAVGEKNFFQVEFIDEGKAIVARSPLLRMDVVLAMPVDVSSPLPGQVFENDASGSDNFFAQWTAEPSVSEMRLLVLTGGRPAHSFASLPTTGQARARLASGKYQLVAEYRLKESAQWRRQPPVAFRINDVERPLLGLEWAPEIKSELTQPLRRRSLRLKWIVAGADQRSPSHAEAAREIAFYRVEWTRETASSKDLAGATPGTYDSIRASEATANIRLNDSGNYKVRVTGFDDLGGVRSATLEHTLRVQLADLQGWPAPGDAPVVKNLTLGNFDIQWPGHPDAAKYQIELKSSEWRKSFESLKNRVRIDSVPPGLYVLQVRAFDVEGSPFLDSLTSSMQVETTSDITPPQIETLETGP
jgi:hypothetical protein